jgi:hypothetical protein
MSTKDTPVLYAWLMHRLLPGNVGQACQEFFEDQAKATPADATTVGSPTTRHEGTEATAAAAAIVSMGGDGPGEKSDPEDEDDDFVVFKF